MDFATGRSAAFFFAQTDRASWLGVLASGLIFALCMIFAGRAWANENGWIRLLSAIVRMGAACLLTVRAAHIGALALPVQHGEIYGAGLALLLAAAVVLTGRRAVLGLGGIYGLCLAAYMVALQFAPDVKSALHCALELRLGNSVPAALLLALSYGALCGCIASGAAVEGCVQPSRSGVAAGICHALLLALANAVFVRHEPILLRMSLPFTALASGWGRTGFFLSALLCFLGCTAALSAILLGCVSKRKSRFSDENRC